MEKRPGNGQSLALAAGKVASFLQNRCGQPLLCLQKSPQIHLTQRFAHLFLCGVRFSHPQVVLHSSFKQVAVVTDQSDLIHQAVFLYLRKLHSPDGHASLIPLVPSHKNRRGGTFAAAGGPHQGGKAAHGKFHADSFQDLPVLLIGKTHFRKFQIHLRSREGPRFLLRLRQIQQRENFVAGRHPVHGDVEKGSQKPQGNKEFRRQQNQHQRSVYTHIALHQLHEGHCHSHRRASISNDIHHAGGVELHGQHLHGNLAEPLGFLIHFPGFLLI